MVGGLLAPTSGRIVVEGLTEDRDPSVGMVFQEVGLFPWRTVESNIGFGLEESSLTVEERVNACVAMSNWWGWSV